ncbi:MAG: peptidylprolyl isomerase, partial [Bdellovibrionales bacterium]|nr:peptidylprolyl isomerase [Bdellovibrionales bacterium]
NIIPGLEKELVGRKPGDSLRAIVNPSEGYGDRDEGLVQQINRLQLKDVPQLELGMQLQSQSEQGLQTFTVVKFDEDKVTLDGNHPLAGKMLHFDIEVRSVRFASESEIKHGHVHGPQQHEHSTD